MADDVTDSRVARLIAAGPRIFVAIGAVLLFLFAVQLLGAATGVLSPQLRPVFDRLVVGNGSAVGISWLAAYGALNGSVVAAVSLSLFDGGVITGIQLFLMIMGSRLGAAGIVVVLGGVDYLQHRRYTLRRATGLGLLTFLVTHTIYLPATALGTVAIVAFDVDVAGVGGLLDVRVRWFEFFAPIATWITRRIGPTVAFLAAFLLLLVSMRVIDRVMASVDTTWMQTRVHRLLESTWVAFGLGFVVTGVVTSVAFSLGVVVPLYNRRYVDREDLIPYVLGASLGTLSDTLLVALILDSPAGFTTVLLVLGVAGVVTLLALAGLDRYVAFLERTYDRIVASPKAFTAFASALVIVPLLLVLLPI